MLLLFLFASCHSNSTYIRLYSPVASGLFKPTSFPLQSCTKRLYNLPFTCKSLSGLYRNFTLPNKSLFTHCVTTSKSSIATAGLPTLSGCAGRIGSCSSTILSIPRVCVGNLPFDVGARCKSTQIRPLLFLNGGKPGVILFLKPLYFARSALAGAPTPLQPPVPPVWSQKFIISPQNLEIPPTNWQPNLQNAIVPFQTRWRPCIMEQPIHVALSSCHR